MSDSVQDFSASLAKHEQQIDLLLRKLLASRGEVAQLRAQLTEATARADSWRATAGTYQHWRNVRAVLSQVLMLALIGFAGVAILAMAIKGA